MKLSPRRHLPAASLASAAIALFAVSLSAATAAAQPMDQIIASVDGEPITIHDLKEFAAANGAAIPDDNGPKAIELKRAALKELITEKMMEQEVKNYQGDIDEAAVDRYIAKVEEKAHLSDDQFRDELSRHGMTYDEFRTRARLEIQKMEIFERQVREKVTVAPDQIAAYYKAHPKDFTVAKERLKLAQILIAVDPKSPPAKVDAARAKAESLRKRALAGDDFAELASKNSDDESKSKGGELGEFSPDDLMDQIKAAVIKLNRGQISEVVETRYGFHIVKVEEHDRPGVKPLAEVREEIRDKLMQDASEAQFKRWVDHDLVKHHHVESYF